MSKQAAAEFAEALKGLNIAIQSDGSVIRTNTPDGRTPREISIDFFMTSELDFSKEECTGFYDEAHNVGRQTGSTEAFDRAIVMICEELKLDQNELERLITPKEQEIP